MANAGQKYRQRFGVNDMSETLITIILAVIGSSAFSAFVSGIFMLVNNRKKNQNGVAVGVRQLLYDRIKEKGKTYISKGEITNEELEDLIAMHKIYHNDLNGNGYLDQLMAEVKKLKLVV